MRIYVVLMTLCETLAQYEPKFESPNVGTVLFTRADRASKQWMRSRIRLLQAREHFQQLIPSPRLEQAINEEYITNLLNYFQSSYSTVKREIKNPAIHNLMNVALSDTLGGYLKLWVLPITKYAYYGGTVSLEKAMSVYQVYDDIKAKLKTNGSSWRSPNENLLNSIVINIAAPQYPSFRRSMKEACKQLTFYEKTDSGLAVPLPIINWDISPLTMFVPIKQQSLIPLTSPSSSNYLLKYYEIAKRCIQVQDPNSLDNFNKRFQSWLSTNIAPHLNDDNLYFAFGSILTVMNETKNLYGIITSTFDDHLSKIRNKAISLGLPMSWSSKKCIIIFIILLIEVIWCIPALFCLTRSRKKKNGNRIKKFFTKIFRTKLTYYRNDLSPARPTKEFKDDAREQNGSQSVKLFHNPCTSNNLEADVQLTPYDRLTKSSSSQSQNRTSSEQMTLVNETPLKSSMRKLLPKFDSTVIVRKEKEYTNIKLNNTSEARKTNRFRVRSITSNEVVESTKTLTLFEDSERTVKERVYSEQSVTPKPSIIKMKSVSKCCTTSTGKEDGIIVGDCTCSACNSYLKKGRNQEQKRVTYIEPPTASRFGKLKKKEKTVMRTFVDNDSKIQEHAKVESSIFELNNSKNCKTKPDHPLLRIEIDRPKAEINVGISGFRKCAKDKKRISKIPRLAIKDRGENSVSRFNAGPSTDMEVSRNENSIIYSNKSSRNQNRTLDDIDISRSSSISKLNITL